jgi:hypothetical protein
MGLTAGTTVATRPSTQPRCSTTCHVATVHHTNYMLRSSQPFPCSLQYLSNLLCGGVLWEPPTVK